ALLMFAAIPVAGTQGLASWLIVLVATLIGLNYGANLALFPAYAKDLWGLRSFGMNYGILFTAWGAGGLVLSRLQQMLTAQNGGSFTSSFAVAGVLLLAGAALTLGITPPTRNRSAGMLSA
ncbi:MAG: MFS transporter, partial [Verrucomicrobia bacterium]|nr:MFS transporter [Verrucomicrobiota bacterium]